MIQEERLVQLFLDLCAFNAPSKAEAEIVAWTKNHLLQLGLEVWEDDAAEQIGGNANNLIARLPANIDGAPRIFFSAHFDTVEPTEGLVIEERDGVFLSASDTILGADDRGGLAPAIEAVHALIDSGEHHGDVFLLFTCAEEIGLLGADALKIGELNLDYGFVLDTGPPVGSMVNRTATHDRLDIVIQGVPAHAGKDPERGVSAIQVAAAAIHGMRLGRIGPETTANLGMIQGGTATNVVPAKVSIFAEARSTSEQELNDQIDHMVSRFEAAATEFGAKLQIEHHRHYSSFQIQPDSPVVQVAWRASEALGLNPRLRTTLGGSDANIYNAKHVPSLVLGTGMDHIHTHDEQISRADLVKTAELALEIVRQSIKQSA
ncbi:MAG: M20/M25/M40 family metallo-hydrolase [Fimbriimonas sp.]